MGRHRPTPTAEFVLFDVLYEDGSITSNRKVPGDILGGLDGDEPARAVIEEQDRVIAERSGRPRSAIKSITRSAARAAQGKSVQGKSAQGKPGQQARKRGA